MRGLVCSHGGADDLWKIIAHTKSPEIQPNVEPHSLEKYSSSTPAVCRRAPVLFTLFVFVCA
jgi:hypothetical protein